MYEIFILIFWLQSSCKLLFLLHGTVHWAGKRGEFVTWSCSWFVTQDAECTQALCVALWSGKRVNKTDYLGNSRSWRIYTGLSSFALGPSWMLSTVMQKRPGCAALIMWLKTLFLFVLIPCITLNALWRLPDDCNCIEIIMQLFCYRDSWQIGFPPIFSPRNSEQ